METPEYTLARIQQTGPFWFAQVHIKLPSGRLDIGDLTIRIDLPINPPAPDELIRGLERSLLDHIRLLLPPEAVHLALAHPASASVAVP